MLPFRTTAFAVATAFEQAKQSHCKPYRSTFLPRSKTMTPMSTRNVSTLAALVLGLTAGSASAAFTPVDVTFGSNNDGDGGFNLQADSGSWTWTEGPEALNLDANSGQDSASAMQAIDNVEGQDFEMSFSLDVLDPTTSGNQRASIYGFLFYDSATLDFNDTANALQFRLVPGADNDNGVFQLRQFDSDGGFSGRSEVDNATGFGVDNSAGATWNFDATGTISGSDTTVSVTFSDGTNSATVSHTLPTADLSGDFFGFGAIGNNSADGEFDFQNFSMVPEPGSLAMGLVGFGALALRRRRRA